MSAGNTEKLRKQQKAPHINAGNTNHAQKLEGFCVGEQHAII